MCGITGIISLDQKPVNKEDIIAMTSMLTHRGPDDNGYALLSNQRVALGHARLSIIDLSTGAQPLYNHDGSLCIVFNGELYDYKSIRSDLEKLGFVFHTSSDTEVALALYEKYDLSFFDKLNGEFAFIIWDSHKNRVVAVRDRIGIKPLYYFYDGKEILFASEVKAILTVPRVPRKISIDFLNSMFFGMFPKALSFFDSIFQLKPGHFMICDPKGTIQEIQYWKRNFFTNYQMTKEEAMEGVRYHLNRAVARRLVADVPVCGFLSGGIDSTIICSEMKNLMAGTRCKTFTISFSNSEYDEQLEASLTAKHIGLDIDILHCDINRIVKNLLATVYAVELPFANAGAVGKYLLSDFVRSEAFKVALVGEGSDELFAGYPYFKLEALWRMSQDQNNKEQVKKLWNKFKKIDARSEGVLWNQNISWNSYPKFYSHYLYLIIRSQMVYKYLQYFLNKKKLGINRNLDPFLFAVQEFEKDELEKLHPLNASLYVTLSMLSNYNIPILGDRVEMAHSIEGRLPFLDKDLVEFVGTIPPEYLLDVSTLKEKYVLYEAYKNQLPQHLHSVHKHPFLSSSWFDIYNTPFGKEIFNEIMSKKALETSGIFNILPLKLCEFIWRLFPKSSSTFRNLDPVIGYYSTVQMLSQLMIEKRPTCDHLEIKDRSDFHSGFRK